jgi:hypothetical protein
MKNGNHTELKQIISNKEKFFIPFSTSHIGDIFSSFKDTEEQRNLINEDLEYISSLTNDKCLYNNASDIVLDYYPPKELFQQRIDEKDLYKDISLDGLDNIFQGNELTSDFGNVFSNLIKSTPIDDLFKEAFENSENAEQMDVIFPGLRENPTLEGFFKCFSDLNVNLNEEEKYKDLRDVVQSGIGIQRDRIFDNKNPYELIDKEYIKNGVPKNEILADEKNAPKWFNEITNECILLDMHGYQEDNINTKSGRKETFKNTTEDAFHSAFASTCNFYVINDKKSYNKTKKVYEKLKLKTVVLKPEEFVEYFKKYLEISDSNMNLKLTFEILNNGEFYEQKLENSVLRTYLFPFFIFDFFNKLLVLIPENGNAATILLSQNNSEHYRIYSSEIKELVRKISKTLGTDVENLGEADKKEFKHDKWIGRKWKVDDVEFKLIRVNGHFQLYII